MQTHTISGFQLSPQQKRLWNLQQESSAFYSQCAVLIAGNIQPEILQASLTQIINQHDILRTNFHYLPGIKTPVMVIGDQSTATWEYLDLSNWCQQDIAAKIQELFWIARQPENINQDSILRLFLIKISTTEHILVISLPALCADTQSLKNLVNQISQTYSQCCQNQELSQEYIQYIQFSEWQNQLLEDEDAEEAKEYWQRQKINCVFKLPGEKLEKNAQFITHNYQLVVSQELCEQIKNTALKYQVSVDIIFLVCWQILIWKITGESEIVIGTAASRREYEELNDTLGLLATFLPIKTQLSSNLCFEELLKLVANNLENSVEWQDYFVPAADDFLILPLGFEFIKISEKSLDQDISFTIQEIYSCIEPFKVKLTCWQKNEDFVINFDYNVNYLSLENVARLARQFQTLLTNATVKPELPISQLDILNQEEYQKLIFELNQTQVDYSQDKCIHKLFAEQVVKHPDHLAVVFENQQITYHELNCKANQLAHYLQKQGVKPDVVVGLYLERSLEMIIGLLGILKAGGAYLPLDSNLPNDAINLRLKEAQVSLVITQQSLVNRFTAETVITIDTYWKDITGESQENPQTDVKPENLVYVIFTSGSTGKPKGVATEHRQLLNYVQAISDQLNLPTSANYATVSSLSADLGNTMIFPALCRGGCLHLISSARVTNAVALAEYCRQNSIDCLKIVPSHLSALLSATPDAAAILPRQCLILGGEAVSWKLISQVQQQAPNCQIFNHYGPTETTIGVLTYAIEKERDNLMSDTVPIGRPLANTQVYILDEQLRPVSLGVSGELYISGAGLSRGYLNQPELTAKSFISHVLLNQELRLYKTGDKVRYLENGNIEFLGRVDNQVKIRGYRIELAEIEITLVQHSTIQQAVVTLETEENIQRLLAYIVPSNHQVPNINELRNFIKQKLPDYMMPSAFVILKKLPLNANGKIDRKALPVMASLSSELATNYEPPDTEIERSIAQIWQQLLHLEKVGINDNFFDIGGHSLLLVQVHAKLQAMFNTELSIPHLFEYPTIKTLAQYLSQKQLETSNFSEIQKRAENRKNSRNIRRK